MRLAQNQRKIVNVTTIPVAQMSSVSHAHLTQANTNARNAFYQVNTVEETKNAATLVTQELNDVKENQALHLVSNIKKNAQLHQDQTAAQITNAYTQTQ